MAKNRQPINFFPKVPLNFIFFGDFIFHLKESECTMKTLCAVLLPLFFLAGCETFPQAQNSSSLEKVLDRNKYTGDFQPVQPSGFEPSHYPVKTAPAECESTIQETRKKCWLGILANSEDYVASRETTYDSSTSFGVAKMSVAGNQYEIVSQWVRFINVRPNDATGAQILGEEHKVGVGARIVAVIKDNKGGINLGDLFAVAASAEAGYVSGSLLFTIQGIHGKGIDSYTPRISKLDQENLRKALDSIQNIKTLLHNDPSIDITPQIVAIRKIPQEAAPEKGAGSATFAVESKKLSRQGWVYVGSFDTDGLPMGVTNLIVSKKADITGKQKVRTNLFVRDDYPQFPSYKLGNQLDVLQESSVVTVLKTATIGANRVWSLVEY